MTVDRLGVALMAALAGCSSGATSGGECAQDGTCPGGLQCFPDWRCYAPGAKPGCDPACYGDSPMCDPRTLRCVACLGDGDCAAGRVCVAGVMRCGPGCSASHPSCGSAGESCDLDLGVCHGCLTNADCTDPAAPRCDAPSGRCLACLVDDDRCPAGEYCSIAGPTPACLRGCKGPADCGGDGGASPGSACCAHRCVDTASDGNHCGGCGVPCGNARHCCGGRCADLATDVDNCGRCGISCALPNVTNIACAASTCSWSGCESFFADCDQRPANGCEVNLTHDPKNCYGCGTVCPTPAHATAICTVAGCGVGPCQPGFADCNHDARDGCEYDTSGFANDVANCGGCGAACAANHPCVKGRCG